MYVCLVLMLVALGEVSADSVGAPQMSCASMLPNHLGAKPSSGGDLLYSLSVTDMGGSVYNVTLRALDSGEQDIDFLGFFIQARNYTSGDLAEGEFEPNRQIFIGGSYKFRRCPGFTHPANGITQNSLLRIKNVSALWSPPFGQSAAGVYFQATVVDVFEKFYVGMRANITIPEST